MREAYAQGGAEIGKKSLPPSDESASTDTHGTHSSLLKRPDTMKGMCSTGHTGTMTAE